MQSKQKNVFFQIQFVHWNSKYDNITEAKKNPDGVAIISVFLKVSASE